MNDEDQSCESPDGNGMRNICAGIFWDGEEERVEKASSR